MAGRSIRTVAVACECDCAGGGEGAVIAAMELLAMSRNIVQRWAPGC